jgi:hypothetical protein
MSEPIFTLLRETPESSNIKSIAYSPADKLLRVKFKHGPLGHCDYYGVTEDQVKGAFINSEDPAVPSVGQWFAQFKKLGHTFFHLVYEIQNPLDAIHKPDASSQTEKTG